MLLNVLDNELNLVKVVDDYVSLLWCKRYYDIGALDLKIEATTENINTFKRGYFITRDDDDAVMRIEALEIDTASEDGNYLLVGAFDCKKILSQRICWTLRTWLDGTAESHLRELIEDSIINPVSSPDSTLYLPVNRQINNFAMKPARNFSTEDFMDQTDYNVLSQKIIDICMIYGWGWKVTLENGIFYYDIYKGTNKSENSGSNKPIIFSPEYETLFNSKYKLDASKYANTALIGGEGEGAERKFRMVGQENKGISRFEMFVDSKDNSSKAESGNISLQNYYELLIEKGQETLASKGVTTSFEGDVDVTFYKYKEDYNLGDIVTIKNEYGIGANARIVEITETWDTEGYFITPVFDEILVGGELLKTPTITVIDEEDGKRVDFSSSDRGVTFYYTLDGSIPTTESSSGRMVRLVNAGNYKIRVIAVFNELSSNVGAIDLIVEQVAKPIITVTKDWGGKKINVTTATDGAEIHYTINGDTPTKASTQGNNYFINYPVASLTFKVIAYRDGFAKSEMVTSINEVIKLPQATYSKYIQGGGYSSHIECDYEEAWQIVLSRGDYKTMECYQCATMDINAYPDTLSKMKTKTGAASFNDPNYPPGYYQYFRSYCRCKGYVSTDILTLRFWD